jgi:hypothetical protein
MRGRRFIALAAVLSSASCAVTPPPWLTVELPGIPSSWAAACRDAGCVLQFPAPGGGTATQRFASWESGHRIACAGDGPMPVLAWPVPATGLPPPGAGCLRPAGALVRQDSHSIVLSWEEGAAAWIALEAAGADRDLSLFNTERLAAEIAVVPDPWDLDLASALTHIINGDFTVNDLDPAPSRDIAVQAGPGTWCRETPFRAPVTADADGVVYLPRVAFGLHALWSTSGAALLVQVGATGVTVKAAAGAGSG